MSASAENNGQLVGQKISPVNLWSTSEFCASFFVNKQIVTIFNLNVNVELSWHNFPILELKFITNREICLFKQVCLRYSVLVLLSTTATETTSPMQHQ